MIDHKSGNAVTTADMIAATGLLAVLLALAFNSLQASASAEAFQVLGFGVALIGVGYLYPVEE